MTLITHSQKKRQWTKERKKHISLHFIVRKKIQLKQMPYYLSRASLTLFHVREGSTSFFLTMLSVRGWTDTQEEVFFKSSWDTFFLRRDIDRHCVFTTFCADVSLKRSSACMKEKGSLKGKPCLENLDVKLTSFVMSQFVRLSFWKL